MKKIFIAGLVGALLSLTAACGNGHRDSDTDAAVESSSEALTSAMESGDIAAVAAAADSMALYLDELTPDENVALLLAFLQLHNDAVKRGDRNGDLEIIRKYVDVYGIVVDENPEDMRAAFARAMDVNPKVDFEAAFKEFRLALSDYDATQIVAEDDDEPAPRAKADSDSTKTDKKQEGSATEAPAAVTPVD